MKLAEEVKKRFNEKYKMEHTPWSWSDAPQQLKGFVRKTKKEFDKPKLLDLGCGNGWLSVYFAKQGFEVAGIDSSEVAIKEAKEKARKERLSISFKVGDALDFPYPAKSFDVVFDRGLFHHQPKTEWKRYIDGVKRILRDNGYFYLIVFSDKSNFPKKKKGRLWNREKDDTGYWSYDHFFNRGIIEEIFGKRFGIVDEDEDKKPQPGGSMVRYFTLKKKSSRKLSTSAN